MLHLYMHGCTDALMLDPVWARCLTLQNLAEQCSTIVDVSMILDMILSFSVGVTVSMTISSGIGIGIGVRISMHSNNPWMKRHRLTSHGDNLCSCTI